MTATIENGAEPWSFAKSLASESANDTLDKKLYQAAGLSAILVGEGHESFVTYNDTIQEAVLWLLGDTIREAMALKDRVDKERRP
jgi:hypothetical protein